MRFTLRSMMAMLVLTGCGKKISHDDTSSGPVEADIIFIIDNSDSMADEIEGLAQNLGSFFLSLNTNSGQDDNLSYGEQEGRFIDYQLGITTTSIAGDAPGRAGMLVGSPDTVTKDSDDAALNFTRSLLCEATCLNVNVVPTDVSFECNVENPEMPDTISQQYLDCLCGSDRWEKNCGSGTEEGLEAAFDAMCRAVDNPPVECFTEYTELASLSESEGGSSSGLIRQNSTVIFVLVSDEGDGSRRIENSNPDPEKYIDLLEKFNQRYRFTVIGPPYDPGTGLMTCNSGGATKWGTERYQSIAKSSDGFFNFISGEDENGECGVMDFSIHFENLIQLLNSL